MNAASVDQQAAYWFAVLRSERVTTADERAFDLWRQASADNAQAYERQLLAWETLETAAVDPDILAVRRTALRSGPRAFGGGVRWFVAMAGAASLAAVVATMFVSGHVWQRLLPGWGDSQPLAAADAAASGKVTLETVVGERSTAALPDGSVVELNTDTQLSAQFTAEVRQVRLSRGQAVFQVAKDARRPFVVIAADRRITALGTQFEVRVDSLDVAVTLLEGRVAVDEAPAAGGAAYKPSTAAVELKPGQQFVISRASGASVRAVNLDKVAGWRQGRLDFENEPLAEVVREINRYSVKQVSVADAGLAALRVSGSFRAGSVDNFATALISLYPSIRQERGGEGIALYLESSRSN